MTKLLICNLNLGFWLPSISTLKISSNMVFGYLNLKLLKVVSKIKTNLFKMYFSYQNTWYYVLSESIYKISGTRIKIGTIPNLEQIRASFPNRHNLHFACPSHCMFTKWCTLKLFPLIVYTQLLNSLLG